MVSVGTIVWLSSELMFFAGLFAMYFVARANSSSGWPPEPTELNLALNTAPDQRRENLLRQFVDPSGQGLLRTVILHL